MYTVDIFFRQRWHDHRLQHNLSEPLTIIPGVMHPADIVWVPDTVFINSVISEMHHVTVNNHKLDIYANGTVFWGMRVTVSPSCYLDLKAYPMDKQKCNFEIVSYTYNTKHLVYEWHYRPGIKIDDKLMAQFEVTSYSTDAIISPYIAGNFSQLIATFKFRRLMGFAVLQIYAPSIAIVCVSWISLWIRKSATPGRVALCITTLLTISTIWSSVNATLPKVSYVKAIDVFLLTSFCCVIMTLMEYTLVLNCGKIMELVRKTSRKKTKKSKTKERDDDFYGTSKPSIASLRDNRSIIWPSVSNPEESIKLTSRCGDEKTKKKKEKDPSIPTNKEIDVVSLRIERFSRVFFPLFYIVFNILYWVKYLS